VNSNSARWIFLANVEGDLNLFLFWKLRSFKSNGSNLTPAGSAGHTREPCKYQTKTSTSRMWNMPVNINESNKKKLIFCLKQNFVRAKVRQVIWLWKCRCDSEPITNRSSENELFITSVNATFAVGAVDIWVHNEFAKSKTDQVSGVSYSFNESHPSHNPRTAER